MTQQTPAAEPKKTPEEMAQAAQVEVISTRVLQSPEMKAALQAYAQSRLKAVMAEREIDKAHGPQEKEQAALQAEWEARLTKEKGYKQITQREKFTRMFTRDNDGVAVPMNMQTFLSPKPLPFPSMLTTDEQDGLNASRRESQQASLILLNAMRAQLRDKEKMFTIDSDGVTRFTRDEKFSDHTARELFRATHRVLEKELVTQGNALTTAMTQLADTKAQPGTTLPFAAPDEKSRAANR